MRKDYLSECYLNPNEILTIPNKKYVITGVAKLRPVLNIFLIFETRHIFLQNLQA